MTTQINQIAQTIAMIDPNVAHVFKTQPYNRRGVLIAFMRGCSGTKYEDISFRIWAAAQEAIAQEKASYVEA